MPAFREPQLRQAKHYQRLPAEAGYLDLEGGESVKRGLALFDLEWRNIQVGQAWAQGRVGLETRAAQGRGCAVPVRAGLRQAPQPCRGHRPCRIRATNFGAIEDAAGVRAQLAKWRG